MENGNYNGNRAYEIEEIVFFAALFHFQLKKYIRLNKNTNNFAMKTAKRWFNSACNRSVGSAVIIY